MNKIEFAKRIAARLSISQREALTLSVLTKIYLRMPLLMKG